VWIGFPAEHERSDTRPRSTARADKKAGFRCVRVNRVSERPLLLLLLLLRTERVEKAGFHCVRVNRVSEEVKYETKGQFFFGEFSTIWILCLFVCPFRNLGEPILPIPEIFPVGTSPGTMGMYVGTLHSTFNRVRIGDLGLPVLRSVHEARTQVENHGRACTQVLRGPYSGRKSRKGLYSGPTRPVLRSKFTEGPVLRSFSRRSWDFFTF
jgi:hypothetical protein